MFFKFFLRKIISTISNSSYTSQIHCRNALRLDPVNVKDVLNLWKEEFEKLYNENGAPNRPSTQNASDTSFQEEPHQLSEGISIMEVKKAVSSLNRNRATGQDMILGEVLRSDVCIFFLQLDHRIFCVCFETGKIPQNGHME